ncbi:MAG: RNA polymerase sigma factor FliA [Helicobacter sp.]|uniref:RNA polymerase sigma factor FliA n=1 Tax=Helicobacter sp. TaxID=218 RepID=UPI002A78A3A8|nr:RNA polymerase sigma factor FliA [Helicobacter sp.]MCI6312356.1 RNA polymerase sigma factor FliA [Helicobacter sp.]MCI7710144.1 RNA polymerase sigma factor FliA [Helicobacter sp.]MDY2822726.1 RNA polymerase sigma factor FliA [Helicobacter sp.]
MPKQINAYNQNLKYAQDELATQYLPAVKAMAFRLKERLPSSIDVMDLVSIGAEELVKLARRYDSSINDSFWGFAKTRVNGAMLDYLRSLDVLSRSNRKLVKSIDLEVSKYFNQYQEEPSDEYLAKVLNEEVAKIKEARVASDIYALVPIDEQYNAIVGDNILEDLQQEELIEIISKILRDLSQREQMIIQLYYFEELSLKEISEVLGITESRISQIAKEVIKKIRLALGEANG